MTSEIQYIHGRTKPSSSVVWFLYEVNYWSWSQTKLRGQKTAPETTVRQTSVNYSFTDGDSSQAEPLWPTCLIYQDPVCSVMAPSGLSIFRLICHGPAWSVKIPSGLLRPRLICQGPVWSVKNLCDHVPHGPYMCFMMHTCISWSIYGFYGPFLYLITIHV